MSNRPALPKRNRRYVFDHLRATYLRITEDKRVTEYELVELEEVISGTCQFAVALDTTHVVGQALSRATDPEYVGDLVALQQASLASLPDAA